MKTVLNNVLKTQDGRYPAFDTTVTADEITTMLATGWLRYDPSHQRNEGDKGINRRRVNYWADQLVKGEALLGQLTWNFRDSKKVRFVPESADGRYGHLEFEGAAYVPDSWHRHQAIKLAAERLEKKEAFGQGSSFDMDHPFSLRIFISPEDYEDPIFYSLNQEGEKAPATRSKMLHQSSVLQKIAKRFVTRSRHLLGDGAENVEIYRNSVSANSSKLVAFNTISTAFERSDVWKGVTDADSEEIVTWLVKFWDKLAEVIPEIKEVDLEDRKDYRSTSIAGTAVAIHGYIGLAWEMYKRQSDLGLLDKLRDDEFFSLGNGTFADAEIIMPSTRSKGGFTTRNSHATQTAMVRLLTQKIGL